MNPIGFLHDTVLAFTKPECRSIIMSAIYNAHACATSFQFKGRTRRLYSAQPTTLEPLDGVNAC